MSGSVEPDAVRLLDPSEFNDILGVINAAAESYRGLIPPERSLDPYMPRAELRAEIEAGVEFWGIGKPGELRAVMGVQPVRDVVLIRHAYTQPAAQGRGSGTALLAHLVGRTERPVLIGTWAGAGRAIAFYERHGFDRVPGAAIAPLLEKYWRVPAAQAAASVVLANVPASVIAPDYPDDDNGSCSPSSSSSSQL